MSQFRAPTIEETPLAAYANADCECAECGRCAHVALACEYTGHGAVYAIEEADRLGLPAMMLERLADGEWRAYLDILPMQHRERATGALWALELRRNGEPRLEHASMRLTDGDRRLVDDEYDPASGVAPVGVGVHAVRISPDAAPEERYAPGSQTALF